MMPDRRSSVRPPLVRLRPRPSPSVRCRRPSPTTEPKAVRSLAPSHAHSPPLPALPSAAGGQDRSSALRPSVRLPAAAFALGSVVCVCGLPPRSLPHFRPLFCLSLTALLLLLLCPLPSSLLILPSFFSLESPLKKHDSHTDRAGDSDGTNQKDIALLSSPPLTVIHTEPCQHFRRSLTNPCFTPMVHSLSRVEQLLTTRMLDGSLPISVSMTLIHSFDSCVLSSRETIGRVSRQT